MRFVRPLALALVVCTGTAAAEEAGVALFGSGLLTLPSTATIGAGHGTLGLTLNNYDRDPLNLDIFDYSVAMTLGVGSRFELYGHAVVNHVVTVPYDPVLPPAP